MIIGASVFIFFIALFVLNLFHIFSTYGALCSVAALPCLPISIFTTWGWTSSPGGGGDNRGKSQIFSPLPPPSLVQEIYSEVVNITISHYFNCNFYILRAGPKASPCHLFCIKSICLCSYKTVEHRRI